MKTVAYLSLVVVIFLQLPESAAAQQTGAMRCQNGIVSVGDNIPDVVKKCGPPTFQDRREQTRSGGNRRSWSSENVTVDDWVYNFGPQEFMYQIIFHNGRVAKIQSLEHGY